jgi:hypothetical protein
MSEILHCERCGGDSPADARFCIDCGGPIGEAATGPTKRLAGIVCPACNTNNPEHARFCVVCGRAFGAAQPRQRPAAPPLKRPSAPKPTAQPSYPRMATPPTLLPSHPLPAPATRHHHAPRNDPSGAVFLIGLVALLVSHAFWPGILVLLGLTNLVHHAARGRPERGTRALIWLAGLAVLFATGAFWPGILILIFISMALGGGRSRHWYW